VCKLYVESPQSCISGVMGSNLQGRIEAIMSYRIGRSLSRAKKLLLTSAGVAALTGPLVIGIAYSPAMHAQTQIPDGPLAVSSVSSLAFEVASVKPYAFAKNEFAFGAPFRQSPIRISGNRVAIQGLLSGLVLTAYNLRTFQLSGAPDWRNETGRHQIFDIEAKAPGDSAPTIDEARRMLQALLAKRFQLALHLETRELPVYDLVVDNDGAKLKPSAADVESKTEFAGHLGRYTDISIPELVLQIGPEFNRPLFDKTGLQGGYDFDLEYMPSLPDGVHMSPEQATAMAKLFPPAKHRLFA
ncbi:MAG: TIGR03435 family protein, partial [Acidobacteriota bacterium]|nr:TIGR03435 family protein [Acidobacteriota bacterium]